MTRPELIQKLDELLNRAEMNDAIDLRSGLKEHIEIRINFFGDYSVDVVEEK